MKEEGNVNDISYYTVSLNGKYYYCSSLLMGLRKQRLPLQSLLHASARLIARLPPLRISLHVCCKSCTAFLSLRASTTRFSFWSPKCSWENPQIPLGLC